MYSANLEALLKSLQSDTAQPVAVAQPVVAQPVVAQPVVAQPVVAQPVVVAQPDVAAVQEAAQVCIADLQIGGALKTTSFEHITTDVAKPGSKLRVIDVESRVPLQPCAPDDVRRSAIPPNVPVPPLVVAPTQNDYVTYFSRTPTKKILLTSTHCHQFTGYSKVSWNLLKILSKVPDFEVYHYGFQKMGQMPDDFRPYPSNVKHMTATDVEGEGGFGFTAFVKYVETVRPDVVVLYNDANVCGRFMDCLNRVSFDIRSRIKVIVYLDQVFYSQRPEHIAMLNQQADEIFVFSDFWKKSLEDQGVKKPIGIMNHGFDPVMNPSIAKSEARKIINIPEDTFLIVSVNRNTLRKRYDLVVMAFADLVCKHPNRDIRLFCVCDRGMRGGYPILDIFSRELRKRKVPIERHMNKLLLIAQDMCHTDETINLIYNSADIGMSCAEGEGFGLCNFEMMGLGKPQVLPEHGAFLEYANSGNAHIVPAKHVYYIANSNSAVAGEARCIEPVDVSAALEQYLMDSTLVERHGLASKAAVAKYTWSSVTEDFVKRLRLI